MGKLSVLSREVTQSNSGFNQIKLAALSREIGIKAGRSVKTLFRLEIIMVIWVRVVAVDVVRSVEILDIFLNI